MNLQDGFPFKFYRECNDLNSNGFLDPGEATRIVHVQEDIYEDGVFDKWVVHHIENGVWLGRLWEYCIDDQNDAWYLFRVVDLAISSTQVFTDDEGDGVEIEVYWLENKKYWYNQVCSDPWSSNPQKYQLFLDAYQVGWDQIQPEKDSYEYRPPGTGLWPPAGLKVWKRTFGKSTFIGNGFLDSNDGHTGYEYFLYNSYPPEQNDLDRDRNTTNDCRNAAWEIQESCQNRHDIEDPVLLHGAGPILVELNVFLCESVCAPSEKSWSIRGPSKGLVYFTIEVRDTNFCDKDGISYDTLLNPAQTVIMPKDIDETGLVILDTEIGFKVDFAGWKCTGSYNLIVIGGPVANTITTLLVNRGISTVDWVTSPGQWEYITDGGGCDILIVAGRDRDATKTAVEELINYLQISFPH